MDDPAAVPRAGRPVVPAGMGRGRVLPGRLVVGGGYRTVRPAGTTDWLLLATVGGTGFVRAGDRRTLVRADRVVLLPPGTPHDYGCAEPDGRADGRRGRAHWDVWWVHFHPRPAWSDLLAWPPLAGGVRGLRLDGVAATRTVAALRRAVDHHRAGLARSGALTVNAVEEALLWCDTQARDGTRLDPRIVALQQHIGAHLAAPHTAADLARRANLSVSRLAHLFAAQTGGPLRAYIERTRMNAARELLEVTTLTVTEVAARVGYPDPLYFSRRFRAVTGLPPSRYRTATLDAEQHPQDTGLAVHSP